MRIRYPNKKTVRDWIVKVMMDDPHLSVLVDLALSSGEHGSKSRRAWVKSWDLPEAIEQIETPWGRMMRWVAASTITKDWSKVWQQRR